MNLINEVSDVAPWFFPVFFFVIGACVGSFLNVCIYRLPKDESVITPRSRCACGAPIAWRDNIPVLSWLLRRGRARCCGLPFSIRYPFVELLTAALFVACWLMFPPGKAVAGMALCTGVIAATFIDLDHMIIPDVFTIGGVVVGLFLSLLLPSLHGQEHELFVVASLRSVLASTLGLLVGSGLVLWIGLLAEAALKKEAMGFGDVKFLGAIGAFIGWKGAVFAMFGGALLGCVWFVLALAWQKIAGRPAPLMPKVETAAGEPAELGLGVHVSFGPMLAAGALLYFFILHRPVDAYFASLAALF
jgi:leader peptidase (prepilin peptidase)/N-methyltransferase